MVDCTRRYLEGLASLQHPSGDKAKRLTSEAAFCELLRGRGGGCADASSVSTTLAPFNRDLVSLPSSTVDCKQIGEL
eukprot:5219138-Pyramimonas_sp.AAC.1